MLQYCHCKGLFLAASKSFSISLTQRCFSDVVSFVVFFYF